MPKKSSHRYAINFDLSINLLRQHYSASRPKRAYTDILRYMLSQNFSHRQWSGYVSNSKLTRPELLEVARRIHKSFPWLSSCENKMDVTVISDIFDIRQIILDRMHQKDIDFNL